MVPAVTSAVGTLLTLVTFGAIAVALWAIVDAAIRPKVAFDAAGQNKTLWIVLPIAGVLLPILGGILGLVYLLVIRPKVRATQ